MYGEISKVGYDRSKAPDPSQSWLVLVEVVVQLDF
jgi:hypothetical protein